MNYRWVRVGSRDAGAIPAASTFSVQVSTGDSKRQDSSNFPDGSGVATNADRRHLRQGATANGGTRPGYATESATNSLNDDPDLAVVVAAWPELPETIRAGIVAMVKAATV
jgi:hypothetical protein